MAHMTCRHSTWQYLKKKYLLKYNGEIYPKSFLLCWIKTLNPYFSLWTKPYLQKPIFFHFLSQPQFARGACSENRERWSELRGAFPGTNLMDLWVNLGWYCCLLRSLTENWVIFLKYHRDLGINGYFLPIFQEKK